MGDRKDSAWQWYSVLDTPVVVFTKTKRVAFCNDAAGRFFGLVPAEMHGKTAATLFGDVSFPSLAQIRKQTSCQIEFTLGRGAERRRAQASLHLVKLAVAEYLVASFTVIEPPNERERELRVTADRYRLIADNTADYVAVLDLNARFLHANPAHRNLGWEPEELIGRVGFELMHPDDVQRLLPLLLQYAENPADRKGSFERISFRFANKRGEWREFEGTATLIGNASTGGYEVSLYSRDVTERNVVAEELHRSREMAQTLINASAEMVVLLEADGTILMLNELAVRELGATREELIGKCGYDFFTPEISKRRREFNEQVVRCGQPLHYEDYDNGRWIETRVFPLFNRDGQVERLAVYAQDVTHQKRIERALRESEEWYRNLIENQGEGIGLVDGEERFVFTNRAAETIFDVEPGGLVGRGLDEFLDEDWQAVVLKQTETRRHGQTDTYELEIRRADNSRRRLLITATPRFDSHGEYLGSFGIFRDITDRIQIEEALRASEERYRGLIESSTDIIYRTDTAGCFSLINPVGARLLGYTVEELQGRHYLELIRPDWRDELQRFYERQLLERVPNTFQEVPVQAKDGRELWIEQNVQLVFEDGHIAGFQAVARDVTERKRVQEMLRSSEERYRSLVETASDGICILQDMVLKYVNPQLAEMLSYRVEDMMDTNFGRYMHPDQFGEMARLYARHLSGERGMGIFETVLIDASGNRVVVEINGSIVTHEGRESTLIMVRDITQRKRAEEALRDSEERFRSISAAAFDAVVVMDPEGRISVWNQAAERMFGYSATEAIGRDLHEMLAPPDTGGVIAAGLERFRLGGDGPAVGRAFEMTALRRDGTEIPVELSVSPVRLRDRWHAVGIIRDITERRRAEEALRESERRLADIINFLPDATMVINREGKVIAWNRAVESMTGVLAKDILGQGDHAYAVPFYGERRPVLIDLALNPDTELERRYANLTRYGDTIGGESYTPYLPGGPAYLYGTAAALRDSKGQIVGAIESIRDVTDRHLAEEALRESEHRYRLIAENISDVVWTMSLDFRYMFFSPSVERAFGYTAEEMLNRPPEIGMTPESWELVIREIGTELAREGDPGVDPARSRTLELEQYNARGEKLWTEVSATFLRDDGGRAIGILGVTRDISARKAAEAALRASEEKYRLVTEGSRDIIWTYNLETQRFEFASSAIETILGYRLPELADLRLDDLFPAESLRQVIEAFNGMIEQWPTPAGVVIEIAHLRKDRQPIWMEVHGSLLPTATGRPTRVVGVSRDVSERKRAEEEQQRLIALIEASNDFIGLATLDGRVTYVNEAGCRMVGLNRGEIRGKKVDDFRDTEHSTLYGDEVIPALRSRGYWDGEGKIRNFATGELIDVQINTFLLRSKFTGQPISIASVQRNITERKRSERALLYRQEMLKMLTNISGRFINVEAGKIDELIGQSLKDLGELTSVDRCHIFLISPDGSRYRFTHEWCAPNVISESNAAPEGDTASFPWLVSRLMAEEPVVINQWSDAPAEAVAERALLERLGIQSVLIVPMFYGGRAHGMLAFECVRQPRQWNEEDVALLQTVGDIFVNALEHKRKEAELRAGEEKTRALLNATTDMVTLIDASGRIQALNEAAAQLMGASVEELIGRSTTQLSDASRALFREPSDAEVFRLGRPTRYEEEMIDRWIDKVIYPIRDALGAVTSVAVFAHDITNLKRAERDLRQALARAQEADLLKSRFLANMSHEIRTPLNHIIGMASVILLQPHLSAEERTNYLQIIKRSGESLLHMINSVLDLAKIEAGKLELDTRPFELHECINQLAHRYQGQCDAKSLRFQLFIGPQVPNQVIGDPFALEQVLNNLLSNALKFTPDGAIGLAVELEKEMPGHWWLHFRVTDSGIGIAPEQQDKIWQSFYQVDSASTRQFRGSGLGLTIARELVRLMNGEIWVKSEAHQGSEFHFVCELGKVSS